MLDQSNGFQSVASGPPAPPGELGKMQIIELHPRPSLLKFTGVTSINNIMYVSNVRFYATSSV